MIDTNIDTHIPIYEELHKMYIKNIKPPPPPFSPLHNHGTYKYGSKHTTPTQVKTTPHAARGNNAQARSKVSIK
jgi:hypothetical protein